MGLLRELHRAIVVKIFALPHPMVKDGNDQKKNLSTIASQLSKRRRKLLTWIKLLYHLPTYRIQQRHEQFLHGANL